MNFIKILAFLVLAMNMVMSPTMAQQINLKSGQMASTLKLHDGSMFAVTLERGNWVTGPYKDPQLWGAWGTTPVSVVALIEVSRNKKKLYVPFSAYADLAEPHSAVLKASGENVELEITGGTGGDSYRAILMFSQGKYLSSRRVMSSVMPVDAREETKYTVTQEMR